MRNIEPNARWLKNVRLNFSGGLPEKTRSNSRGAFRMRFAMGAMAAVLVLSVGGGVVNSAQAALPSDMLYPIKLLSEQFQSFFVFGNENKINFALKLAERRLDEAEQEAVSSETESDTASTSPFSDDGVSVIQVNEDVFVGSVSRAGEHLEKAQGLLNKISNSGKSVEKKLKNLEKALDRLENVKEKKESLAKKLKERLAGRNSSALAAAFKKIDSHSVDIEKEAGKVVVTIYFEESEEDEKEDGGDEENEGENATTTPESGDDDDDEDYPIDVRQIVKLLTDGAGKSGKIPPGLLKAPGIRKKLQRALDENLFNDVLDDIFDDDDEDVDDDDDEDTTPPEISYISISDIDKNSITVSWITNEGADSLVRFGTDKNYGDHEFDSTLVTSHSISLTDLTASTTYHFQIESKDKDGNTAISSDHSFTTLSDEDTTPPLISAVSVTNVSTNSAEVSWSTDEDATSKVYYGSTTPLSADGASFAESISFVMSHSLSLTGLTASSTYYFIVESADAGSNIATSSELNFVTDHQ